MLSDNSDALEPTIFSAVLRPHRSLRRTGFVILMLLYGTASFGCGVMFITVGAWPIFGVLGASVLLLYWAFRVNYARAAAFEEITMTPSVLTIRKVSHRGRNREFVLNPLWVRLDKVTHDEYGVERVFLVSRGRELSLGSFLGPDEKARFADALGQALGEAKRGVTRTVLS
jgi:uncharacterized membrane protein